MKLNKKALLLVTLWAGVLAFAWTGWTALRADDNYSTNTTLPAATPRIPNATEKLSTLIEVAIQNDGVAKIRKTIHLHIRDDSRFRNNLFNIAAQRGWFIHSVDARGISVVAPAEALTQINDVTQNPVKWILTNRDPGLPAQPPADTSNLVNVRLDIQSQGTGKQSLYFLAEYLCLVATIFTLIGAIGYTGYLASNRTRVHQT